MQKRQSGLEDHQEHLHRKHTRRRGNCGGADRRKTINIITGNDVSNVVSNGMFLSKAETAFEEQRTNIKFANFRINNSQRQFTCCSRLR